MVTYSYQIILIGVTIFGTGGDGSNYEDKTEADVEKEAD